MADFQSWLEAVGFKRNPFERSVADNDEKLDEYFIKFPYYSLVLGQAEDPQTTFLFAERGGGKTANRIQVEQHCNHSIQLSDKKSRILGVPFTDFTTLLEKDEKINLHDYVHEILKQAVPAFYDTIFGKEVNQKVKYAKFVKNLSPEDKDDLAYYVMTYSNRLSTRSLRRDVRRLQPLVQEASPETIKNAIKSAADMTLNIFKDLDAPLVSSIAGGIHSLYELTKKEELKDIQTLERSPLDLLKRFYELVRLFGIEGIYIIIDRVDEYAGAYDLNTCLTLITPLLKAIPLLELPGIAFKFFLPAEIKTEIIRIIRTDRFSIYDANWNEEDLKKLLQSRLETAAIDPNDSQMKTLSSFCIHKLKRIDSTMVTYSRSPRDLIRLGHLIFAEHGRQEPVLNQITEEQVAEAITKYVHERLREMEGAGEKSELIAQLAQIGEPKFRLTDVVASLSMPEEEAYQFLRDCEKAQYISASYEVTDPRLQTYIRAMAAV